ncbi:hypothetical protein J6590_097442 [Homalodisca vitripennis]|nr:hypothetical protein J6590_097442 [Homalodisca vitripennis]
MGVRTLERAAPRSRVRRGIIPLPELLGEVERNLFRWGGAARRGASTVCHCSCGEGRSSARPARPVCATVSGTFQKAARFGAARRVCSVRHA